MYNIPPIEKNRSEERKDILWIRVAGEMKQYIRKESKSLGVTRAGLIRWCVQFVKDNDLTNKIK